MFWNYLFYTSFDNFTHVFDACYFENGCSGHWRSIDNKFHLYITFFGAKFFISRHWAQKWLVRAVTSFLVLVFFCRLEIIIRQKRLKLDKKEFWKPHFCTLSLLHLGRVPQVPPPPCNGPDPPFRSRIGLTYFSHRT